MWQIYGNFKLNYRTFQYIVQFVQYAYMYQSRFEFVWYLYISDLSTKNNYQTIEIEVYIFPVDEWNDV